MNNKNILQKLVKIAQAQQKILTKIAQSVGDLPQEANNYIKSITSLWLSNNGYPIKYGFSLEDSNDPNFNYELKLTVKSASPNFSIPANFAEEYKNYVTGKLANNPLFKGKTFKIEVQPKASI